jgi:hypothetical protein
VQSELSDLNGSDAIVGYRMYITWAALEPTMGNYDFSLIDGVLARLKTGYSKPKQLVVYLLLYGQNSIGSNDSRIVPLYIQQNATYGASPVAGSYGWWGKSSNGVSSGMYAPALYYPPVMDRLIALVQALGNHLDGDPNVEAISFQEDATIAQAASFAPSDPNYSDAAWSAQLQRVLQAATAAFPHTNVILDNSYFNRPSFTVALTQWMLANRIALGAADTWGQSGLTTYGTSHQNDGLQTYMGVSQYGGLTDLRSKTSAMMAIESPDLLGPYFAKYGGPWTPVDLINALNQTYHASHAFWTDLGNASDAPAAAKWSNIAAACAANPLIHTEYPASYP